MIFRVLVASMFVAFSCVPFAILADVNTARPTGEKIDYPWDPRRGCCSWHGGVSHCDSDGNIICNDGTRSPTCGC